MKKGKIRQMARKTWHFLWEDDSLLSWAVNLLLAFILIKFVVYPGLGFALGTSHPVVAVVSGSMEHDGSFDDWWESPAKCSNLDCTQERWYAEHDIAKSDFRDYSFRNGFNTGDIIVLVGKKPADIEKGDVIVFWATKEYPIIHRVIEKRYEGDSLYFTTKGDHNPYSGLDDMNIREDRVVGKALFRIPYLGWIKIGFFRALEFIGVFRLLNIAAN